MACEIRWKTSPSATCLHVATCKYSRIAAADPELAAAIDGYAAALILEIQDAQWPVDDVLAQLASLASEIDNNRALVTRAVTRLQLKPIDALVGRVAGAIADVEAALRRFQPEIVDELAVRGGPLREQWQARGPGFLIEATRMTDAAIVPESAEVVLVSPYAGGHGAAHPVQNRATFEAVLVNPHADLPEAVRLGWLLCQLNADLPCFAEALPPGRAAAACRLAMLAPALAAAEVVEWARCDEEAIDAAIDAWRLRGNLPEDAASRIWQWWSTWVDTGKKWPIAVAALDQLLAT